MGRSRPKGVLGRSRPKKLYWANLGPKVYWADIGPQKKFSSGPDPAQKTGLGQDPPGPATKRAEGINFPRPCMQNAIRSACREGNTETPEMGGEKGTWRGGGGGAVVAGGGCGGGWRRCDCFRRFGSFSPLLLFSLFFSVFSFLFGLVLPLFPFLFSVFRSPLFLLSPSFYLFLSLSSVFSFFFLPVSPLFFLFFLFSSLPPLLSAFLASIYRGQGCCFLQLSWGAAGWSAIGRGCRGSVGGARWLVGHCVRSVGSRREWPAKIQKKATLFPFFPAA